MTNSPRFGTHEMRRGPFGALALKMTHSTLPNRRARAASLLAALGWLAPALLLGAATASHAEAQCEPEPDVTPQTRTLARNRYAQGVEASQRASWDAARDAFQSAYEIAPFAPIVYNLATAQVQTGLLVEAAENYRRFLRRCPESSTPEQRTDAQTLLTDVLPRIANLRLQIENLSDVDSIDVDGQTLPAAALDAAIPVNPGDHTIRVSRGDEGVVGSQDFSVREGGTARINVRLAVYTPPADNTSGPVGQVGTGGGGGDDAGLIAGVTIAVVLAVAAAVIIPLVVVLNETPAQAPDPVQGTWEPARLPLLTW